MDLIEKASVCLAEMVAGGRASPERVEAAKAAVSKVGEWASADLATGGLLTDEQSNRFIRTVIEGSQLLPVVRVVPMKRPTRLIERIAFTTRLLSSLTELTAPASAVKPTTAKVTLDTFEYGGLVKISYDTLQDSIEGGREVRGNPIEATLREIISEAVARDVEHIVLNSDTASADPLLDNFNGVFKAASNQVGFASAPVSKAVFKDTLLALPKRFRQNKSRLLWLISPSTDTEWRDELADRGTSLGDEAISALTTAGNGKNGPDKRFGAYGVPMLQVTGIPEDGGAGTDETKVALTDPRNIVVGFWRDVYLDWQKEVETRSLKIMVSLRVGFAYEDPDGAAAGNAIKVA